MTTDGMARAGVFNTWNQAVGFVQRLSGVHLDYTNHAWKVLQLYLIAFANHIY
jgi:hypothetical protein